MKSTYAPLSAAVAALLFTAGAVQAQVTVLTNNLSSGSVTSTQSAGLSHGGTTTGTISGDEHPSHHHRGPLGTTGTFSGNGSGLTNVTATDSTANPNKVALLK